MAAAEAVVELCSGFTTRMWRLWRTAIASAVPGLAESAPTSTPTFSLESAVVSAVAMVAMVAAVVVVAVAVVVVEMEMEVGVVGGQSAGGRQRVRRM